MRALFAVSLTVLTLAAVACGTTQPAEKTAAAPPPDEPSPGFRLPADTHPLDVKLALDVDPSTATLSGTETIRVHLDVARRTLWLHGKGLTVTRAVVDGRPARWAQVDDDGLARLSLDAPVGPGDVDIELAWTAPFNESLEAVYRVQADGEWYAFTQFEAISARESFPCFDEPGFKNPWTLSLTHRPSDVAVANTAEVSSTASAGGKVTTTFRRTAPLPVYLVAFAVGPLEIVDGAPLPPSDVRPQPLPIRGVAVKGRAARMKASLDVAAKCLASLERWFGIGYPYEKVDIVAVPDFSAGAMENAGLVTFRDNLLFVDATSPLGLQRGNVHVIAHELAHQWFGDYVTLAWWDDIWLNEAFATWTQSVVVNDVRPDFYPITSARSDADWVMAHDDSLMSARQIRQPIVSQGDILTAFDGITYDKGAAVIEMFRAYAGEDAFQKGVREYMKAHAHGTATAGDLLAALSSSSGKDIAGPFNSFLEQPGVPFVTAKLVCDAQKKSAVVELEQQRFLPVGSTGDRAKLWQVPVCVRAGDGKKAWSTTCTLLTKAAGALELSSCPKVIHPNADGRGYYRWSMPADQLAALSSSIGALSPGERISYANAIRAAVSSASLPFEDALAAAAPLAKDDEPDVAGVPAELLAFAWRELVDDVSRPRVAKKIVELYQPVLDKVKLMPGKNEDARVRDRRTLALDALADDAEDPATLAALAKMGRAVLGLDGPTADHKLHVDQAPPDLVGMAIEAAVRAGGPAVWDDVNARLASETDSQNRAWLLGALAAVVDPALSARARDLVTDPRLKVNEVMRPLWHQIGDVRTAEATWAWLPSHYDALVARLPRSEADVDVVSSLSGFCSEARATEVEAFFSKLTSRTPGLDRALAQTVESIRLCAARKTAHTASARKLFAKDSLQSNHR
jgi:alanyl aminopeptidase